jgi:hypothetical protein
VLDLKSHWETIIATRPGYDHPDYTVSDWKRDVLKGETKQSYAHHVAALLDGHRPEIPDVLFQFRPRTTAGKTLQRAAVREFDENGACLVAKANGHGWFVIRHAFENLVPFIVAKGENAFIVAKATSENRHDLRELGAQKIYEWDGLAVPRFEDM